ncbi:MAG: hypothetical protein LBK94_02325 [Prevotellaceae bacterium]|jgi:hypothetical protein|nr:hypothetical protein [Prevotellaceae bacterium]
MNNNIIGDLIKGTVITVSSACIIWLAQRIIEIELEYIIVIVGLCTFILTGLWICHKFYKTVGIKKFSTKRATLNLNKIINSAKESVDFLGISGKTLFDKGNNDMCKILTERKKLRIQFRFLLLDPESDYLQEKVKEEMDSGNIQNWKDDINNSIKTLYKIGMEEVQCYDAKPIWNILRVDNKIFLSYYGNGRSGREFPVIKIENNTKRSTLYIPIMNEFEYLWKKAKKAKNPP